MLHWVLLWLLISGRSAGDSQIRSFQEGTLHVKESLSQPIRPAKGKIYDCGANVVYCMAKLFGVNITYAEALQLVPPRPTGNNMLEVKAALSSLGFEMEAFWLEADELVGLVVPAVVLDLSKPLRSNVGRNLGHFLVVWPHDPWYIVLIDWPGRYKMIGRDAWREYFKRRGISRIPVLLYLPKADG